MISPKWFEIGMIQHFGRDPAVFPLDGFFGFFDHMKRDGDVFVTEPYLNVEHAETLARRIAGALGCEYRIKVPGEWHPKTVRIEFHPNTSGSYRSLDHSNLHAN